MSRRKLKYKLGDHVITLPEEGTPPVWDGAVCVVVKVSIGVHPYQVRMLSNTTLISWWNEENLRPATELERLRYALLRGIL